MYLHLTRALFEDYEKSASAYSFRGSIKSKTTPGVDEMLSAAAPTLFASVTGINEPAHDSLLVSPHTSTPTS